jgi:hypothetical protein
MTTTEETPPHPATAPPPIPAPPAATPEVIVIEEENPVEMVPEQEVPEAHEVILADAEPELPALTLNRDHKGLQGEPIEDDG